MALTLRVLNREAVPACMALKVSDVQQNHSQLEETPEIIERLLQEQFDGQPNTMVTIHSDDTMVGFAAYSPSVRTATCHVRYFLIDEQYQG